MIFSSLMVHTKGLDYLGNFCGKLFCRIFHVSESGTFAVISGFLCGYPMGARVTSDLIQTGRIDQSEGNYLLTFTNSTSPAFIINFLAAAQLGDAAIAPVFLAILYISAYLTSHIFRRNYVNSKHLSISAEAAAGATTLPSSPWQAIETAVHQSTTSILQIGGYLILFSVLLSHITSMTNHPVLLVLGSFLEITNGIPLIIREIPSIILQYTILMALTAFGGVCSIIQTQGMISESGLNLKLYIVAKLTQAAIASILLCLWLILLRH
jgi:sporulation integral membrane protein YlbJ